MIYNPQIHHRRSIRLKGYDYSQAGLYYITICCDGKLWRFGKIENGEMILNDFGQIAQEEWEKLPERYPNVILDVFQIMPNHIHFVFVITDDVSVVGATLAVALDEVITNNNMVAVATDDDIANYGIPNNDASIAITLDDVINDYMFDNGATARVAPTTDDVTVGNIVGAYKSLVLNRCLELCKQRNEFLGKFWQRNYYEKIIRNQRAYQNIYKYIISNPMNWETDELL